MPRKRIEFSLSIFQTILLGMGGIAILLLGFSLGVLVGNKVEGIPIIDPEAKSQVVKMRIEPPVTPAADTRSSTNIAPAPMSNVTSKPVITFYDTLTKPKGSDPRIKDVINEKAPEKKYAVQVSSMRDRALADAMASKLKKAGYSAYVAPSELKGRGTWYRVRLGTFSYREEAGKEALKIKNNEGLPATVVEK